MNSSSWETKSLDRPIVAAGQLLVEGRTAEMFFRELVKACQLEPAIDVRTYGNIGTTNLQRYLEFFRQKPAFKERVQRLGIVRDAESNEVRSAFQSVQDALRQAGLPVPERMQCFEGAPLKVGVFILPNCKDNGMLEDLCLAAIQAQPEWAGFLACGDDFFACLARLGQKPANKSKARIAAYALARDVIDPQLGRAAQKGAIPWDAKALTPVKTFLAQLAGL